MLIDRNGRGPDRFTWIRVGMLFAAAGVWIGGLVAGRPEVTGAAIVIVVAALALGVLGRRRGG